MIQPISDERDYVDSNRISPGNQVDIDPWDSNINMVTRCHKMSSMEYD